MDKSYLYKAQKLMTDYAVAEAKAKKEKAEVELETAKMQQQYTMKLLAQETKSKYNM